MKPKTLDQEIIDAYEGYIWNVNEAVRFVEMGSGSKHKGVFDILRPILEAHEKEMYAKIEKAMNEDEGSVAQINESR